MVLELPKMAERDKVLTLVIGLKHCAHNELKRQKIKTLDEAFVEIYHLVENYDEGTKE